MTIDDFYWYSAVAIFLPWLLLLVAPRWRYTEPIVFGAAFLLIGVSTFFTIQYLASGAEGSFSSLDALANLFRSKQMLLTGWLNYLAFALLVGTWQVHDARQENIPFYLVIPALLLTALVGPVGLLFYLLFRFFKTKSWNIR